MNGIGFIFETLVLPAVVYLLCLFVFQYLALRFLKSRHSSPQKMTAFLSRYTRAKRLNFDDDTSVSLAYIQRYDSYGWGMMGMGMGMFGIFLSGQTILQGEPNWLFAFAAFLVPATQGHMRAVSKFAAICFSELGISTFTEAEITKNG